MLKGRSYFALNISLVWNFVWIFFWGVGICLVWCCFVLSVVEDLLYLMTLLKYTSTFDDLFDQMCFYI